MSKGDETAKGDVERKVRAESAGSASESPYLTSGESAKELVESEVAKLSKKEECGAQDANGKKSRC